MSHTVDPVLAPGGSVCTLYPLLYKEEGYKVGDLLGVGGRGGGGPGVINDILVAFNTWQLFRCIF